MNNTVSLVLSLSALAAIIFKAFEYIKIPSYQLFYETTNYKTISNLINTIIFLILILFAGLFPSIILLNNEDTIYSIFYMIIKIFPIGFLISGVYILLFNYSLKFYGFLVFTYLCFLSIVFASIFDNSMTWFHTILYILLIIELVFISMRFYNKKIRFLNIFPLKSKPINDMISSLFLMLILLIYSTTIISCIFTTIKYYPQINSSTHINQNELILMISLLTLYAIISLIYITSIINRLFVNKLYNIEYSVALLSNFDFNEYIICYYRGSKYSLVSAKEYTEKIYDKNCHICIEDIKLVESSEISKFSVVENLYFIDKHNLL